MTQDADATPRPAETTPEPPPPPAPEERLSRAWLDLEEAQKARFLKQLNERAPKMLENWMLRAGVAGMKRAEAARRAGEAGAKLDALVADVGRAPDWAFLFVDWFKHVKTYLNDFCTKVQQELAVAGTPVGEVEGRMIAAVRERYRDDPFLELFVATVEFHNRAHE